MAGTHTQDIDTHKHKKTLKVLLILIIWYFLRLFYFTSDYIFFNSTDVGNFFFYPFRDLLPLNTRIVFGYCYRITQTNFNSFNILTWFFFPKPFDSIWLTCSTFMWTVFSIESDFLDQSWSFFSRLIYLGDSPNLIGIICLKFQNKNYSFAQKSAKSRRLYSWAKAEWIHSNKLLFWHITGRRILTQP